MKDKLINLGVGKGLDKVMLENKYKEFYDIINKQINDAIISDKKAIMQLKAFIKKLLLTPTERLKCVVLGNKTTDFGAIMHRKHNGVYPEGHNKANQPIPESEKSMSIILVQDSRLITVNVKENDFESITFKNGDLISISLVKGFKENQYWFDENVADIKIERSLSYTEIKEFIKTNLANMVVSLSKLKDVPNYEKFIVKADSIVNMRNMFDNVYINIDDASLDLDDNMEVLMAPQDVNFALGTEGVIFVVEKYKTTEKGINLSGYAAFTDAIIEVEPMVDGTLLDDVSDNKETVERL